MTGVQGETAARAEEAAKAAVSRRFGDAPTSLSAATGGLSNHVFHVETASEALVVRLGPAGTKSNAFERERMVIARVREAGVPAPEVLALDEVDGLAVMIARRLPGEIAKDHPERLRTLLDLGALAAERIHVIRTHGFGCDFSFEGEAQGNWRDWLTHDYDANGRLATLHGQALISEHREAELRETLAGVSEWSGEGILNHGDLRLKNVMVDQDGSILGLIDWEDSRSTLTPHWDLSVALHDLWVDQIQAFLKGYGLDEAQMRSAAPIWRLFNTLNYAPEVERALEAGDEDCLEQIRTRFSGAFDLFGDG